MNLARDFRRNHFWILAIVFSAAYCFALGVFSLAWPFDGVDFKIFYKAGVASLNGLNPYTMREDEFAYPPAWVPFCVLFAALPLSNALSVWKALNILFFVGAVILSIRLFTPSLTSFSRRAAIWTFALVLWATISTLFTGNTSLLLLFLLLLSIAFINGRQDEFAGLSLGLALIKPPLALPLLIYFLYRRKYRALFTAFLFFSFLCAVGVHVTGVSLTQYLDAIKVYSDMNPAHATTTIGAPHLVAMVGGAMSSLARQVAFLSGALVVLGIYSMARKTPLRAISDDAVLPFLLLAGPTFFGARGYDLVMVIPAFAWFVGSLPIHPRTSLAAILCSVILVIPQQVMETVHRFLVAHVGSHWLPDLFLPSFRSWILLALLAFAGTIVWTQLVKRRSRSLLQVSY